MGENIIAREARAGDPASLVAANQQEPRPCFYCLEGWVFLGSLDHDGEEVVESIRCRRCGGTGRINR